VEQQRTDPHAQIHTLRENQSRTAAHYVGPATRNTLMRPDEIVNVEVINRIALLHACNSL
jgi:hypothetical protein